MYRGPPKVTRLDTLFPYPTVFVAWCGIGDTIRVSLSAEPEDEVLVGFEILKALGIRNRGVRVVSCPSCARQGFDVIRTVQKLEERLQHIRTPMSLSVLGCVVNGPGEADRKSTRLNSSH